ncbi:hypothetical protein SAMN05660197_0853 [Nitratiruptor tergarcus DSM 16512]|uniref:Uncharacterized protein n=1 Tax=Nitratiruptor tergarcus DSM 16512 TaxID=1069081 RepID=A0A1W1WRZ4_9BACT|nr:hypothetical protein SAMN05660197_0853 [Nitratiruptor tergarcus DSM 16512]
MVCSHLIKPLQISMQEELSKEEALLHASSKSNLNLMIDHIDKSQDEFVGRDSDIIDLKIK